MNKHYTISVEQDSRIDKYQNDVKKCRAVLQSLENNYSKELGKINAGISENYKYIKKWKCFVCFSPKLANKIAHKHSEILDYNSDYRRISNKVAFEKKNIREEMFRHLSLLRKELIEKSKEIDKLRDEYRNESYNLSVQAKDVSSKIRQSKSKSRSLGNAFNGNSSNISSKNTLEEDVDLLKFDGLTEIENEIEELIKSKKEIENKVTSLKRDIKAMNDELYDEEKYIKSIENELIKNNKNIRRTVTSLPSDDENE